MVDIGDIFKDPVEWSDLFGEYDADHAATAKPLTLERLREAIEEIKNAPPKLDYTWPMVYGSDPMQSSFSGVPVVEYDGTNAEQIVAALQMEPGDFIAQFPEKPILVKGNLIHDRFVKSLENVREERL